MAVPCYTVNDNLLLQTELSPTHLSVENDSAWDSNESSPRPELPEVRLMQWNIHGWRSTYHQDNFDEIVAHVRAAQPDVLVLNEVLHPYALPKGGADEYLTRVRKGEGNGFVDSEPTPDEETYLHRLATETGLLHYVFGQAVSDGYFGQYGYGNAILSRFELTDAKHTVMPADSFTYTEARRIEAEDRCISLAVVQSPKPFTVVTTHLDQLDEGLRTQQSRVITDQMREHPGSLLVGDLNTYQASDYSEDMWDDISKMWQGKKWGDPPKRSSTLEALSTDGLKDAHYLCKRNSGLFANATCWTIEPLFRIDYCLFDKTAASDWHVEQIDRVVEATCSDHFPIVMDLAPTRL